MTRHALVLTILLGALAPTAASARHPDWVFDQEDEPKRFDLSLLGTFSFDYSVGGSMVFGFAVAPKGFIPHKNDAFFLEIDAGASHRFRRPSDPFEHGSAHVAGGARYQLHLLRWFAPYVAARGGARFWFRPDRFGRDASPYFSGAIGAFFYPSKVLAFRVEVGYPGVRGGIVFYF